MASVRHEVLLKGRIINTAAPAADANIFSTGISVSEYSSTLRVYACFSNAGVLSVYRTIGAVNLAEKLNSGDVLIANSAYTFSIPVQSDSLVNFRYSAAAGTIVTLIVEEVSSE